MGGDVLDVGEVLEGLGVGQVHQAAGGLHRSGDEGQYRSPVGTK